MKCNACYSENVNDAVYCKSCGRNITETYIGSRKGQGIKSIVIFLSFAIVVAMLILGSRRWKKLFGDKAPSESLVKQPSVMGMSYDSGSKETLFVEYDSAGKSFSVVKKQKGKYALTKTNGDAIICKRDGKLFCLSGNQLVELEGCNKYVIGESGKNCAYITGDKTLFFVANGKSTKTAEDVKAFCISQDGNSVAYQVNSLNNEIYILDGGTPKLCYVDSKATLSDFVTITADKTVYFEADGGKTLVAVPCVESNRATSSDSAGANTGYKKFLLEGLTRVVDITDTHALVVKADGATYRMPVSNGQALDEQKLYSGALTDVLVPDGYIYNGDFLNCMFYCDTNSDSIPDSIVKIAEDLTATVVCKSFVTAKSGANFGFLYYTDSNGRLYRRDSANNQSQRLIGENVTQYITSDDCNTVYYIDNTGSLYKFDGQLTNKLVTNMGIQQIELDYYGTVILKCGRINKSGNLVISRVFSYTDKLNVLVSHSGIKGDEAKVFSRYKNQIVGTAGDLYYCIDDDTIYPLDSAGVFSNVSTGSTGNDTASQSGNAQASEG